MATATAAVSQSVPTSAAPRQIHKLSQQMANYLIAGYTALYVTTHEFADMIEMIRDIGGAVPAKVPVVSLLWTHGHGLQLIYASANLPDASMQQVQTAIKKSANAGQTRPLDEPIKLLGDKAILPKDAYIVCYMPDYDDYLVGPAVRQAFTQLAMAGYMHDGNGYHRMFVISSAISEPHPKVAPVVTALDYSYPDLEELGQLTDSLLKESKSVKDAYTSEMRLRLTQALVGMSRADASNILALTLNRDGALVLDVSTPSRIIDEKIKTIQRLRAVTYIPSDRLPQFSSVCGFENLAAHIQDWKFLYSPAAQPFNLDMPRGLVLCGPPGTGKSRVAMALGQELGFPVAVLDIGLLFGQYVGETENAVHATLKQIDAQNGCVLLIDEADSMLQTGAGSGDSGVTARVYGKILHYLTVKNPRTFVILTMNKPESMPEALLRFGRFDAVMHTELPGPRTRREIVETHLRLRGRQWTYSKAVFEEVVIGTAGMTGAALERLVSDACVRAARADRLQPSAADMRQALSAVVAASKHGSRDAARLCVGAPDPENALVLPPT